MLNRNWRLQRALCALVFALATIAIHAQLATAPPPAPSRTLLAEKATPAYTPAYVVAITKLPEHHPVADKKFIAMSALTMGLTVADIERTQHCLGEKTCQELNPMLPHSRAGMYAVNLPINAAAMFLSYHLKESGHKTWWIAPLVVSGSHAVGAGIRF